MTRLQEETRIRIKNQFRFRVQTHIWAGVWKQRTFVFYIWPHARLCVRRLALEHKVAARALEGVALLGRALMGQGIMGPTWARPSCAGH